MVELWLTVALANLGKTVLISGTVGAATEASKEGVPGIAFSGDGGSQAGYDTTPETYQKVYADLATNVTQSLIASGKPYLPTNIWLNVNFPKVSDSTCSSTAKFKFVLSRINSASSGTADDTDTCGTSRLPTENSVVEDTPGCYASISVGVATTKADASAAQQAVVLKKLKKILSCLPSSTSAAQHTSSGLSNRVVATGTTSAGHRAIRTPSLMLMQAIPTIENLAVLAMGIGLLAPAMLYSSRRR